MSLFRRIADRPVEPVFAEVQRDDRESLDKAVLEAFGLDPRKYLRLICEGLTEMVREQFNWEGPRKRTKDTVAIDPCREGGRRSGAQRRGSRRSEELPRRLLLCCCGQREEDRL